MKENEKLVRRMVKYKPSVRNHNTDTWSKKAQYSRLWAAMYRMTANLTSQTILMYEICTKKVRYSYDITLINSIMTRVVMRKENLLGFWIEFRVWEYVMGLLTMVKAVQYVGTWIRMVFFVSFFKPFHFFLCMKNCWVSHYKHHIFYIHTLS